MQLNRFTFGYILVAVTALTPAFYKIDFLNPVTISAQVIAYVYWTYLIYCLHSSIIKNDPAYPFGPKESMLGALVPFAYIFWNWCWVHEAGKWSKLKKHESLFLGALTAVASIIAYPDNLHKIPGVVNVLAFVFLFAQANFLRAKIDASRTSLPSEQTVFSESADKIVV